MKFLVLFLFVSGVAFAKRGPAPEVKPLVIKKTTYKVFLLAESCRQSKNPGYQLLLSAQKMGAAEPRWMTELFHKNFNCKLETDVQVRFPKSLLQQGSELVVTDEDAREFRVDLKTGKLLSVKK